MLGKCLECLHHETELLVIDEDEMHQTHQHFYSCCMSNTVIAEICKAMSVVQGLYPRSRQDFFVLTYVCWVLSSGV